MGLNKSPAAAGLLENRHPHPRDGRIAFREADHKYWVDGDCENLLSCTAFIHSFFAEFDAEGAAGRIVVGWRWATDPAYPYYRMAPEAIVAAWAANGEAASAAGTALHAAIEYQLNGLEAPAELPAHRTAESMRMYEEFAADHARLGLAPWRTEQMVFPEPQSLYDSTFSRTVWRLYLGGAKGLVMWY